MPVASPPLAVNADRSADAAAAADRKRRAKDAHERKKARDREYQRRKYDEAKAQRTAPARAPEEESEPAAASSPLADDPRPQAEQPPNFEPPPFLRDQEKFARFLAETQGRLRARAEAAKKARLARIAAGLGWADDDGKASFLCQTGVSLAWPWLQEGGLEFLMNLPPQWAALLGFALLVTPAALVALDEYQDHRAQRERAANNVVEIKKQPGAAEGTG